MQPERFGLRGTEDLGGGMRAEFRLEGGLLSRSGSSVVAARLFNRESSVGLGGSLGTVRIGRLPDLMYDYIPKYLSAPALTAMVNKHPGNWDNYASQYQFGNALMYISPKIGGLEFAMQYGLGEVPNDSKRGRNLSIGATYTHGGWRTAIVASEHRNRPVAIADRLGLSNALGQALVPGTSVMTDAVRNFAIGSSYRDSRFIVGAAYSRTRMTAGGFGATQDNYDLAGAWSFSKATTVQATLTHSRFEDAHWNQLTLSGIYAFSRRTSAYVQGRFQRAGGSANFAAIADIGISSSPSPNCLGCRALSRVLEERRLCNAMHVLAEITNRDKELEARMGSAADNTPERSNLNVRIAQVHLACVAAFERYTGINLVRWRVLHRLSSIDELTQKELVESTGLDAWSITRAVKPLEEDGFVERRIDPTDNRLTLVRMTQKGRTFYGKLKRRRDAFVERALSGVSDDEVKLLGGVLSRIEANLRDDSSA